HPPVVAPPHGNGLSRERVRSLVLETMAEVTRYPADLLVPDASLEDDLGIDSDKLAKVVAAVRSRLGVGTATAETSRPVARTVGDLVAAAQGMIPSAPAASFAVTSVSGPSNGPGPANGPAHRAVNGRGNGAGEGPAWSLFDREPAEPALERWPGAVPGPRAFKAHTNARPFDGKVALITGSGHGLGRAIAV